jgi:Helix-turn-helix domain
MSVEVMQAVIEHSKATGVDRMVLLIYAWHADKTARECWPSNSKVAGEANALKRMVIRSKKELIRIGELYLLERGSNRRGFRKTDRLKVGSDSWQYCYRKGDKETPLKGDNRTVSQVTPQPSSSSEPKENQKASPTPSREHSTLSEPSNSPEDKPFAVAGKQEEEPKTKQVHARKRNLGRRHGVTNRIVCSEDFPKLQPHFRFVTVTNEFDPAKAECAKRYPEGGDMRLRFFLAWLQMANERAFKRRADRSIAEGRKYKASETFRRERGGGHSLSLNRSAYLVLNPPIEFWPAFGSIPKLLWAVFRSDWQGSLPRPDAGSVIYGAQKFDQRVAIVLGPRAQSQSNSR